MVAVEMFSVRIHHRSRLPFHHRSRTFQIEDKKFWPVSIELESEQHWNHQLEVLPPHGHELAQLHGTILCL